MFACSYNTSNHTMNDVMEFIYKDSNGKLLDYSYFEPGVKINNKIVKIPKYSNLVLSKFCTNLTSGNMFINSPFIKDPTNSNLQRTDMDFIAFAGNPEIPGSIYISPLTLKMYIDSKLAKDPNFLTTVGCRVDYDYPRGGNVGVWNGYINPRTYTYDTTTKQAISCGFTKVANSSFTVYVRIMFKYIPRTATQDARTNNTNLLAIGFNGKKPGTTSNISTYDHNTFSKINYNYDKTITVSNGIAGTKSSPYSIELLEENYHDMWVVSTPTSLRVIINKVELPLNLPSNILVDKLSACTPSILAFGGCRAGMCFINRIWAWDTELTSAEIQDMNTILDLDRMAY